MKLSAWLKNQEHGTRAKMRRALGVHGQALDRAQNGRPISYDNAKRISDMTDSAVSVDELCDPSKKRGAK